MKIKCSKCGKEVGASKKRYTKLLEKFGSESELKEGYICRECRPKPEPKEETTEEATEDETTEE